MIALSTIAVCAHVILGTLAVILGATALSAQKGGRAHVRAGKLFVLSMGLSSVLGGVLGLVKYEILYITFHAGILGTTLMISGILAARIRTPHIKKWFVAVGIVNAINAAGLLSAGLIALRNPGAILFGFPAEDYFFLLGMATVVLIGDLSLSLRAFVSNKHRIAQHLLRMCIGFFIAAGSAFTGPGANAFPQAIQQSGLLSLPELTIFLLMLFWLFKTLRRSAPQPLKSAQPSSRNQYRQ